MHIHTPFYGTRGIVLPYVYVATHVMLLNKRSCSEKKLPREKMVELLINPRLHYYGDVAIALYGPLQIPNNTRLCVL